MTVRVESSSASLAATASSDAELIERLRDQQVEAPGLLFDRYYVQIYRTALTITHDDATSLMISPRTASCADQHASRIDTSLPLMPWLYRVAVNLSYTWITRRQKRRISLEALVDQLISPPSWGPEQQAEQGETIRRACSRRSPSCPSTSRPSFCAPHDLSDLPLEAIAEFLQAPLGTVKSRLYARSAKRCAASWSEVPGSTGPAEELQAMPDRMDSGDLAGHSHRPALRRAGAPSAARQARARSALLAAASGPAHPPTLHSPGLRARAVTLGALCGMVLQRQRLPARPCRCRVRAFTPPALPHGLH
jgi:RNA polymerase sigma-70 factor (ECF subfamily)